MVVLLAQPQRYHGQWGSTYASAHTYDPLVGGNTVMPGAEGPPAALPTTLADVEALW